MGDSWWERRGIDVGLWPWRATGDPEGLAFGVHAYLCVRKANDHNSHGNSVPAGPGRGPCS